MALECYKCGAYPNHPNKTLDTLKLIQCMECGVVACMRHRDGMVGGKCAECGSSRSTIVAFQRGTMGKHGGIGGLGAGPSGGGGGGVPSVSPEDTKISTNTLKQMQQLRIEAAKKAKERKEKEELENLHLGDEVATGDISEMGPFSSSNPGLHKPRKKDSEELKKLLGDKEVIMAICPKDHVSEELISSCAPLVGVMAAAQIDEQKNSDSNSNADNYGTKKEFSLIKDSEAPKTYTINLNNRFFPVEEESFKIEHLLEQKKELSMEILEKFSEILEIDHEELQINFRSKLFVPLEFVDRFMILDNSFYKKNNLKLITGIKGETASPYLEEFLENFKNNIKDKKFISGFYIDFDTSVYYPEYSDIKEIIISTLDMAFEYDKRIYISAKPEDMDKCIELFEEYDLSSLKFTFINPVEDEKTVEFIKKNNINILITSKIDLDFYKEHFSDYTHKAFIASGKEIFGIIEAVELYSKFNEDFKEKLLNVK